MTKQRCKCDAPYDELYQQWQGALTYRYSDWTPTRVAMRARVLSLKRAKPNVKYIKLEKK